MDQFELMVDNKYKFYSEEDNKKDSLQRQIDENRYVVIECCTHNGFGFLWARDIDAARNIIMNHICHVNNTLEQMRGSEDGPFWVFEHEGRLYNNLGTYGETDQCDLLFKNYTDDKPTTIEEFGEYMMSGNSVCLGWGDRAPILYRLVPTHHVKVIPVNLNADEADLNRDFFNC